MAYLLLDCVFLCVVYTVDIVTNQIVYKNRIEKLKWKEKTRKINLIKLIVREFSGWMVGLVCGFDYQISIFAGGN